jgi:ferric-dicitrate binding protein FerR (iron transport regulator)
MNKETFIKYFRNELSEVEEKALFAWIEESDRNKQEFLDERKFWDLLLLNTPTNTKPLENIGGDQSGKTKKRWILEFSKIAAVFIIAALIGALFVKTHSKAEEVQAWNTIEVPIGQRTCITLTDGTKVWLNAKTKFSFPDKFRSDIREVRLDGEAVFDVTHNEKANFVVRTKQYNVKVLGTKFSVYAYNNSQIFEATLVRGKISLEEKSANPKPVILYPNQMATYNGDLENLEIKTVDAKQNLYWIEGIYSFDNQPLSSIIQRLERYYEVKIRVDNPELLNNKYTGKFRYSDSIDVILEVVKKSNFFNYKKINNEIIIY